MSRLRHFATLLVAALAVIGLMTFSSTGVGAAPPSETFDEPGSHSFVVPDGVTSLTVDVHGAAGGAGYIPEEPTAGGLGGRVTATIAVTPGETLQVNVGGVGGSYDASVAAVGGVNGGGDAGSNGAGGGGGGSDVRRGGSTLGDRVVVAGGGGGGGGNNGCESAAGGVGGGDTPTAGQGISGSGGGAPGGADAGGSGGAAGMGQAGSSGSAGAGGAGAPNEFGYGGGGGGGGWYGGGGGGSSFSYGSGGGGGSAYVAEGATGVAYENGSRTGDGLVVLSWNEPEPTTTTAPPTTTAPTTTAPTTTPPTTEAPAPPAPPTPGRPAALYGATPGSGTTQLTAMGGGSLTINSEGWAPGALVTVTMYSTPTELGRVTADASGSFVQAFTVPATAAVGEHRIELTGIGADGSFSTVTLALDVTAPGTTTAATPASLAFTC